MISVVMAAYDRAATLPRAVDSVLGQSCRDWELIVVDDASADETAAVLQGYDDPRIHVFRHGRRRGAAAARNSGLDLMTGAWFAIVDPDDEIVPDALSTLLDTAAQTGAATVVCNCLDARTGRPTGRGHDIEGWKSEADTARLSVEGWGMHTTELLGGLRFDERLPGMECVLWTKLAHVAGRRYFVSSALRVSHGAGDGHVATARRPRHEQAAIDRALVDDPAYLEILRATDPGEYHRLLRRVWRAKVMSKIVGDRVSSSPERDAAA